MVRGPSGMMIWYCGSNWWTGKAVGGEECRRMKNLPDFSAVMAESSPEGFC